jgi:hypothetical protein
MAATRIETGPAPHSALSKIQRLRVSTRQSNSVVAKLMRADFRGLSVLHALVRSVMASAGASTSSVRISTFPTPSWLPVKACIFTVAFGVPMPIQGRLQTGIRRRWIFQRADEGFGVAGGEADHPFLLDDAFGFTQDGLSIDGRADHGGGQFKGFPHPCRHPGGLIES